MTTGQAVEDVLDETLKGLASLNLESLQAQEKQVAVLAQSNVILDELSRASILMKKRVLELVLHKSALNLNALNRLYGRDTRDTWGR
jgi:hypothetical protein